jgi:hypothetical protein
MPEKHEEKKDWLKKMVGELLEKVLPDTLNRIAFINQGNNAGNNITMVEVKLEFFVTKEKWERERSDQHRKQCLLGNQGES